LGSGRGTRPELALTLVGAGMLVVIGYPLVATRAVDAFGARAVGAALLVISLASLIASTRRSVPGLSLGLRVLPLAVAALAVASDDVRFVQLVPAAIEAMLCGLFLGSLRGGRSILQQVALTLEPFAPDFIAPYCRKASAAFALLFAAQATALVALAFAASTQSWAGDASLLVWAPTLAGMAVEFLVRKVWFRNYGPGLVDRVFRALLPPGRKRYRD
jgi:uncharacterized membrane protein